jgi:hypothetical protein
MRRVRSGRPPARCSASYRIPRARQRSGRPAPCVCRAGVGPVRLADEFSCGDGLAFSNQVLGLKRPCHDLERIARWHWRHGIRPLIPFIHIVLHRLDVFVVDMHATGMVDVTAEIDAETAMPPMPAGDPFEIVTRLLEAEDLIRKGKPVTAGGPRREGLRGRIRHALLDHSTNTRQLRGIEDPQALETLSPPAHQLNSSVFCDCRKE